MAHVGHGRPKPALSRSRHNGTVVWPSLSISRPKFQQTGTNECSFHAGDCPQGRVPGTGNFLPRVGIQ